MALTWFKAKIIPINLKGQYATLVANVATNKYCHFDEIHNVGSK